MLDVLWLVRAKKKTDIRKFIRHRIQGAYPASLADNGAHNFKC